MNFQKSITKTFQTEVFTRSLTSPLSFWKGTDPQTPPRYHPDARAALFHAYSYICVRGWVDPTPNNAWILLKITQGLWRHRSKMKHLYINSFFVGGGSWRQHYFLRNETVIFLPPSESLRILFFLLLLKYKLSPPQNLGRPKNLGNCHNFLLLNFWTTKVIWKTFVLFCSLSLIFWPHDWLTKILRSLPIIFCMCPRGNSEIFSWSFSHSSSSISLMISFWASVSTTKMRNFRKYYSYKGMKFKNWPRLIFQHCF